MTSRLFLLACLAVAIWTASSVRAEDAEAPARPEVGAWIGLGPLDGGGRVPFCPSTAFEKYLLDSEALAPAAGDRVRGSSGREAAWVALPTDEKGHVNARGMAWAYAPATSEADGVWLADLQGVSAVYVNGAPHYGDVYGHGITKTPVRLRKGLNHVFAVGFRGPFRASFERPPAPLFLAPWDATLPDLPVGASVSPHAGILVVNASEKTVQGVSVEASVHVGGKQTSGGFRIPMLLPLTQVKIPILMDRALRVPNDAERGALEVMIADCDEVIDRTTYPLVVRDRDEPYRRTFVSAMDRSVQLYGIRPPRGRPEEGQEIGLVLSLHGASVDTLDQAKACGPKPDSWIVTPTNRRPFGFDWQDWGRLDACEVLRDAIGFTGVDRRHVHLTGHSMGGHGTWHIAANDPDGFASIAQHHWMRIEQPLQYGTPARARVDWDEDTKTLRVAAQNVRRLHLDVPGGEVPEYVAFSDRVLPVSDVGSSLTVLWRNGRPRVERRSAVPPTEKSSARCGPFKRAFENGFALVVGTAGDDANNKAWLDRARFDAERWRYRGNGYAELVTDAYFLANGPRYAGRNVILYGNARTNRAWEKVLASPVFFTEGAAKAGKRSWEGGDLAGLFVHPRADDERGLAGAVTASGAKGLRLTIPSHYLTSGVGFPDYVVFGPEVLKRGDTGVKVAGFFDRTWRLAE